MDSKAQVTFEIVKAILAKYSRRQASVMKLIHWTSALDTLPGDNYMAIIYSVKIFMENGGNTEILPVVVKVLPGNEVRLRIISAQNSFLKEVNMYQRIIPALEQFQRESCHLSASEMTCPWPECFASKTDGKEDYLAMEDLKCQGYKMLRRQDGLDFEHCKLVLETMARFHAVSFAMFLGDQDKLLERWWWLEETKYREDKISPEGNDMIRRSYLYYAAELKEAGEEFGGYLVEKIYSEDYYKELYKLLGAKRKLTVIGHGDCWTNNILFRYDPVTHKPVQVKFVDFQVTRVCSPAADFYFFLYSSPEMQVLNEREAELKTIYFEEFTMYTKRLGVKESDQVKMESFEEEMNIVRYYGVLEGFMMSLFVSAEPADVPEMENLTQEDLETTENHKSFWLRMMNDKALDKMKNLARVHLPKCPQMRKHLPLQIVI